MATIKHPTKHQFLSSVVSVITNKRSTPVMPVSSFMQTQKNLCSLILRTNKKSKIYSMTLFYCKMDNRSAKESQIHKT